jgi:glucose/arabinose dehydrogenase/PKD repeat protein
VDGQIVNPSDVHMETDHFVDSDPGDTHLCSDWAIWTIFPSERVWYTDCIGGVERVHTHLGDGEFENSHADLSELLPDTEYKLRVRFRDDSGDPLTEWSNWSERYFTTGSASTIFPLEIDDIALTPVPAWKNLLDQNIILTVGNPQPKIILDSPEGELFLEISGFDGVSNQINNPAGINVHKPLRIIVDGGSGGFSIEQSTLVFTDQSGIDKTVYLPSLGVNAGQQIYFWVSSNGSTYFGNSTESEPNFANLAQGIPVPWSIRQSGYKVEKIATGFQLPVNIAFVPNPGNDPEDPFFYVTELYGNIKVVKRNNTVGTYASGLLNFDPTGNFPGSGEQGLAGIVVDSVTGDVFAAYLYDSNPPNGAHYPKVVRFTSNDGGLTAATETTILDMPGETQGQSHFISNLSIGPDGKLYVHMGDGFDASTALNLNSFRGKILRVNLDGSAPSDNPFYDAGNGITATDYLYAYGFRNPFGGGWRASDGFHYEVENGPGSNDRFAKVEAGVSYGWNGDASTMTINAIYNWNPTHAPVNICFIQPETFDGSGFPANKMDRAFVTESGPTWATGQQTRGKRIVEFELDDQGNVLSGPTTLVEYTGSGKATAIGLTQGPDGLYFTDLYKDMNYSSPIDPGANVLRVKFIGNADFEADVTVGLPPLTVNFTNLSNVPDQSAWHWSFGDGDSSTVESPSHTYTSNGLFNVRLEVTGSNGVTVKQKNNYIIVGDQAVGLMAEYFDNIDLTNLKISRVDPNIDFDWGNGSPDPSIGSNTFSVRWFGGIEPQFSENYTFRTFSDDGVRLWIDDQLIIDQWNDHPPTSHTGNITLNANERYSIKMEYYENGGGAVAQLYWSSSSLNEEIVPQNRLYIHPEPLPVELTSFTARVKNSAVELKWITETEVSNYGFDIEKKILDGEWIKIGFVEGHGNSNSPKIYSFIDNHLIGSTKFKYRLKQIDTDGTFEYSDEIKVEHIPQVFALFQNYPNPFNPSTNIRYQLPVNAKVEIKIFDLTGAVVITQLYEEKDAGMHEIEFNAHRFASGIYYYRIQAVSAEKQIFIDTKKMILLK